MLEMKGIFVAFLLVASSACAQEPAQCEGRPECERARGALVAARNAVKDAMAHRALWTTAQSAMTQAEAAYAKGDFATAAKAAESARELALLGIAQTAYPPFPPPKP
jgi:hypothetical protein